MDNTVFQVFDKNWKDKILLFEFCTVVICCYIHLVVEAKLVSHDRNMIDTIVFPNDTMAAMFSGAQITIPRNALIHQRETESKENVCF